MAVNEHGFHGRLERAHGWALARTGKVLSDIELRRDEVERAFHLALANAGKVKAAERSATESTEDEVAGPMMDIENTDVIFAERQGLAHE